MVVWQQVREYGKAGGGRKGGLGIAEARGKVGDAANRSRGCLAEPDGPRRMEDVPP